MTNVDNTAPSRTPVHNPSSCTCGRIVWLSAHCDFFAMTISPDRDARIDAKIGNTYKGVQFHPDTLKEAVAGLFWEMWNAWEPNDGIKIAQR